MRLRLNNTELRLDPQLFPRGLRRKGCYCKARMVSHTCQKSCLGSDDCTIDREGEYAHRVGPENVEGI